MNISEVASMYDFIPSTFLYYEKQGIMIISCSESGNREYSDDNLKDKNLNWIEFIKLMRATRLSIESLVESTKPYQKVK